LGGTGKKGVGNFKKKKRGPGIPIIGGKKRLAMQKKKSRICAAPKGEDMWKGERDH